LFSGLGRLCAAVRGCGFSAFACGIPGTRKNWLLAIFDEVCDDEELTIGNVVPWFVCATTAKTYQVKEIISKASAAFIDAHYYDRDDTVHQLSDGSVVVATTAGAQAHMLGERDPNSGEQFSCDIEAALHNLTPGLLIHDHRVHTGVPGAVLLKHNPKDCGIYRFSDVYYCMWRHFTGRATRWLRAGLQRYL
jgi:hypothetical protein